MTRWGVVATVKAPLPAILDFAAWHLSQGAHRLYLYLDDDPQGAEERLRRHPRIRVTVTDAAYWAKRNGRPDKHQVRQTVNARHAANRRAECDWLAHIDVDEFLLPDRPLADQLAELPNTALCARVRPVEALAPGDGAAPGETAFKAFPLDQRARQTAAEACFPTWGQHLSGGFLSHVAGKLFFRTGLKGLQIRIHNVILDGVQNPGEAALTDTELGHFHAADWDHFRQVYRFRLTHGSYRAELNPQVRRDGALNLHDLFGAIEASGGEDALRAFYDEVCTASAGLCTRLEDHGLLRRHRMALAENRARHFPDFA
ncbi:glycosyltransferase family 2 protein [Aestuariicoccus sp. MJ-SS9]|uniref:glycosyltransferase family 2 protein n=1 Tax=Aestuariicoccus sp. MJ-SS9 TaxID=3079855 RepID=UPI0029063D07|nr:glycosyltransferase family 2 protein [Aestuariicoccus sp. MJ-SS9]MDU8910572.1 glycosyltransferase family 2 protein [Aestuariicoccus sp. MJ-SS9]